MTTPIIDPSTLTEEQREAIKKYYEEMNNTITDCANDLIHYYGTVGGIVAFEEIFGKEFFNEKGE